MPAVWGSSRLDGFPRPVDCFGSDVDGRRRNVDGPAWRVGYSGKPIDDLRTGVDRAAGRDARQRSGLDGSVWRIDGFPSSVDGQRSRVDLIDLAPRVIDCPPRVIDRPPPVIDLVARRIDDICVPVSPVVVVFPVAALAVTPEARRHHFSAERATTQRCRIDRLTNLEGDCPCKEEQSAMNQSISQRIITPSRDRAILRACRYFRPGAPGRSRVCSIPAGTGFTLLHIRSRGLRWSGAPLACRHVA